MADQAPARRHFIVEQDETGGLDREHSAIVLADLEGVLASLGGVVTIAAQRTKIDEIAGQPVAVTTRLVIEWRAFSPLPMIDPLAQEVPGPEPHDVPVDAPPFEIEEEPELELDVEDEPEHESAGAIREAAARLEAAAAADPGAFELSPEELEEPARA